MAQTETESSFINRQIELDDVIVTALADLLETSNQSWEKLTDFLDLPVIIKTILGKQSSPLVYLLSNLYVSSAYIALKYQPPK